MHQKITSLHQLPTELNAINQGSRCLLLSRNRGLMPKPGSVSRVKSNVSCLSARSLLPKVSPWRLYRCKDAHQQIYRFLLHMCTEEALSVLFWIPSHPNKHIFKLKVNPAVGEMDGWRRRCQELELICWASQFPMIYTMGTTLLCSPTLYSAQDPAYPTGSL